MHAFAEPLCARPHRSVWSKSVPVLFTSAVLCCASAVKAGTPTATDLYTLNEPGSDRGIAVRSAAGGQVVGTDGYGIYPFVWNGSSATSLDHNWPYFGRAIPTATDGQHQVGYARSGGYFSAVLWSGSGSAVILHPSGWSNSSAWGVCGAQQVGYGSGPATGDSSHALVWNGTAESVVDLHPAGWASSTASGTDGTRQVGSGNLTSGGQSHALLWDGSADSSVDLHPAGFKSSVALGIWGTQQVGSGYPLGDSPNHALLWNGSPSSAIDLHPADFSTSTAVATNGRQQVGYGYSPAGVNHAFYWAGSAESFIDLHTLLPAGFNSSLAFSIDTAGNIYGVAYGTDNSVHAIVWSVPEPASLILLALGGVGLLRRFRANRR